MLCCVLSNWLKSLYGFYIWGANFIGSLRIQLYYSCSSAPTPLVMMRVGCVYSFVMSFSKHGNRITNKICKCTTFLILYIWSHGFKVLSCRCYIKLYDSPPKSTADGDEDMSKLLPSQKKKMRQKQRKAEARAKKVLCLFYSFCLELLVGTPLAPYWFIFLLGGRRKEWGVKH